MFYNKCIIIYINILISIYFVISENYNLSIDIFQIVGIFLYKINKIFLIKFNHVIKMSHLCMVVS